MKLISQMWFMYTYPETTNSIGISYFTHLDYMCVP
jgi:hypothetical protein